MEMDEGQPRSRGSLGAPPAAPATKPTTPGIKTFAVPVADTELREELAELKFGALKKRAAAAGLEPGTVQAALEDAADPKSALIDLIVALRDSSLVALRTKMPQNFGDLKEFAVQSGVQHQVLQAAIDDADDPANAVKALIETTYKDKAAAYASSVECSFQAKQAELVADLGTLKADVSSLLARATAEDLGAASKAAAEELMAKDVTLAADPPGIDATIYEPVRQAFGSICAELELLMVQAVENIKASLAAEEVLTTIVPNPSHTRDAIVYRCQYNNALRSCSLDCTWPVSTAVDVKGITWDGKASQFIDLMNPCFQRLLRCGLLCRSSVFKHTLEDKTITLPNGDTRMETEVTEFWKLPIKDRCVEAAWIDAAAFGDFCETGFVRFMEELRYKEDEMIKWSASITDKDADGNWSKDCAIPRPIFTYDKVEAAQKAIKEGRMALQGWSTPTAYTSDETKKSFLAQDTITLFPSGTASRAQDKTKTAKPEALYETYQKQFGWPTGSASGAELSAQGGKADQQLAEEKAAGGSPSWKFGEPAPWDDVAAHVTAIQKAGCPYIDVIKANYPTIAVLPFNSKNEFMATVNMVDNGSGDWGPMLFIKGGSDVIMNMAENAKALTMRNGEATQTPMSVSIDAANENIMEMCEAGERVLSFAEMKLTMADLAACGYTEGMLLRDANEAIFPKNQIHDVLLEKMASEMVFLGNFSLMDPA